MADDKQSMKDEIESPYRKKLITLFILKILRKHSDRDHTLSQSEIQKFMKSDYQMEISQKTIRRNLLDLVDAHFPIKYRGLDNEDDAITRNRLNERQTIYTGWYYNHKFEKGELRLLIDSVLLADGLTKRYRTDLIQKIERLSSKYFHSEIPMIDMEIYDKVVNGDVCKTLEDISDAIASNKQISFHYCDCGLDGKLHERVNANGDVKLYIVNPYQIISKNGHSYLICNLPQYNDLTHFRIDRIKDSHVLKTMARSYRELKGFESGIRLSEYIKMYPNLWGGNLIYATFQCKQYMMNDVADSFGNRLNIQKLPNDMMQIQVHVSEEAMFHWAIQFADAVEIISPVRLRERVAETLRNALQKYEP